jgi:hypothetical protein
MAPQAIEERPPKSGETIDMNGRTIAGVVLALLLVAGAAAIGISAYNAGVTAGLVEGGQVVVAPGQAVGPYVGGYGWGHGGFGIFGFLGFLLFLFILFALIRAAFGFGRGRGGWGGRGWGPGGPGWGGPGMYGKHGPWDERIKELHDELHRTGGTTGQAPDTTGQPPTDTQRT